MVGKLLAALLALLTTTEAGAAIAVRLDAEAARRVLAAVRDPSLTEQEALATARLAGNRGLIRKAHSYHLAADEAQLAAALLAASRGRDNDKADAYYGFAAVRRDAARIDSVLAALSDPSTGLLDGAKARIARYAPSTLGGTVTGYLVAGGSSGGFSFDEPEFFMNLQRFQSAPLAATIIEHELYHAVQNMARAAWVPPRGRQACLAAIPSAARLEAIFDPLMQEGSAAYVGDVLALPGAGDDAARDQARQRFDRGVALVGRSVTLLGLSTHAVATGSPIGDEAIYGLGFYGDEILYYLGYVMARAIEAEQGPEAIAGLIGQPGAVFVARYVHLKAYGTDRAPALDAETAGLAERLARCA